MKSNTLSFWSRAKVIIVGSIFFLILSLLDATLTLWGLGHGVIEENPIVFIDR